MDVDKATRSVKQLSLAERTVARVKGKIKACQIPAKSMGKAKQLSLAEPTAAKGGKFSRTNESSKAQQVRGDSERKDMRNLANVTNSVKQLSLAERTLARGDTTSNVKGKIKACQIPAKSMKKGGKFSLTNESSKAQQVRGESKRKLQRVCIRMPDVEKPEKIKLQMDFLAKVVSCPVSEAYAQCFACPGTFTARLTDEEILKLEGMEEVYYVNRGMFTYYDSAGLATLMAKLYP